MWICGCKTLGTTAYSARKKRKLIRRIRSFSNGVQEERLLLLESWELEDLKGLIEILECGEDGCKSCCRVPGLGDPRALVSEFFPTGVKRLHSSPQGKKEEEAEEEKGNHEPLLKSLCSHFQDCFNPFHWSLLVIPDIPSVSNFLDEDELLSKRLEISEDEESVVSFSTCESLYRFGVDDKGNIPWCKLAYWEECRRVGPQFPVFDSTVDVFSEFVKGSGFSLSIVFTQNKNPSSSTLETRKKIGRGIALSQEPDGVWIYNRSSSSLFVNSPTLDFYPLTGNFITHKIPPGHSLLVFDYRTFRPLLRKVSRPRLDVASVRVSFAKGWGTNYKRQNVTNCPCWLEIMLISPE